MRAHLTGVGCTCSPQQQAPGCTRSPPQKNSGLRLQPAATSLGCTRKLACRSLWEAKAPCDFSARSAIPTGRLGDSRFYCTRSNPRAPADREHAFHSAENSVQCRPPPAEFSNPNANHLLFVTRLQCCQIRHDYCAATFVTGSINNYVREFEWAFLSAVMGG